MKPLQRAYRGASIIQMAGLIVLTFMVGAIGIDMAVYFGAQNQLQTAADAAALSAAREMAESDEVDPNTRLDDAESIAMEFAAYNMNGASIDTNDVTFGYIDPDDPVYDENTFEIPDPSGGYTSTNGYNAVRVVAMRDDSSASGPLSSLLANMFGVSEMNTGAMAVTMMEAGGGVISTNNSGVRPIYVCQGQLDYANNDGNIENNTIRIYGSHVTVDGQANFGGCPAPSVGNWGFADLRDCSSGSAGTPLLRDWFENGYPGAVEAGQCYSTKPGNPISAVSGELSALRDDSTEFLVPIYDSFSGGGSNGKVNVVGFAGFVITSYKPNGSAASRYIEGHFTQAMCTSGCQGDPARSTVGSITMSSTRKAALH